MGKNNARIPDVHTLIAAGIDPKTGLPIKAKGDKETSCLKENIRKLLRIMDEQDATNRYTWHNLPGDITSDLLERILYYRAEGVFFYLDIDGMKGFYFLPYALDGSIDVYGRYTGITPLPFNGTASSKKKESEKEQAWITGLRFLPQYSPILPEDLKKQDLTTKCVILKDYTIQYSQNNISRSVLQEGIIDVEANLIPYLRTALSNNTGISGMRVNSPDEASNVEAASATAESAALNGRKWMAFDSTLEWQEFTGNKTAPAEEFLVSMQALDNFRLSAYGIKNGGLFQKKSHMLQDEEEMTNGADELRYLDGLKHRQEFCNIVNSIWGLGIWCTPTAIGQDSEDMEQDQEDPKKEEAQDNGMDAKE